MLCVKIYKPEALFSTKDILTFLQKEIIILYV